MEFKDRIKQLRTEKDMTAAQLATVFENKKSEAAIRAWELGRSKPDADTLIVLSKFFECSTDYLLGLVDYRNKETINHTNHSVNDLFLARGEEAEQDLNFLVNIYTSNEKFPELCFPMVLAQISISVVRLSLLQELSLHSEYEISIELNAFYEKIAESQKSVNIAISTFFDSCKLVGGLNAIKNAPKELKAPLAKILQAAYPSAHLSKVISFSETKDTPEED